MNLMKIKLTAVKTIIANEGIEILYTRDCQAWPETLTNLQQALKNLQIDDRPQLVIIDTQEQAEEYGFFASPTVHINGTDADPMARRVSKRGIGAGRPYFANGRSLPAPTVELLERALKELYLKPENLKFQTRNPK